MILRKQKLLQNLKELITGLKEKKQKEKSVSKEEVNQCRYVYSAKVVDVYDGDTIRVHIDLGFGLAFNGLDGKGVKIRLYGVDTPELRGGQRELGLEIRDWVREMILHKDVIIKTIKDKQGKYGRYLADIYIGDTHINGELIKMGYYASY